MDKLWILTEERPKPSVIKQIIQLYCDDFNDSFECDGKIKIKPIFTNGVFQFHYLVEGISVNNACNIIIKTVSGSSSFIDFLVFKQDTEPSNTSNEDNILMAIEETKTSDDESRNTGVYQRGSKFVFIEQYYKSAKLYMLYNDELGERAEKQPSDTSIFGTNILLTLGVKIVGKDTSKWFKKYDSIEQLIKAKQSMRKPPAGNVPITICKNEDIIEISGRLSKPGDAGNIGHDPNIGALSMISKCLRVLGWNQDIVITQHGVIQSYVDRTNGKNKFLYISRLLDIQLKGISLPNLVSMPEAYWHYEMSSEKMSSILLHMVAIYNGLECVYENHAGCERGYFRSKVGDLITLPKKDKNGINLYLPDVVLYDSIANYVLLVEGKKLSTMSAGLAEIEDYGSIEEEYIKPNYPNAQIQRWVSLFGGEDTESPNTKVLIYMNINGIVYINDEAPERLKEMFRFFGVAI